ncbi:hypothetical protein ACIBF6_42265 [Streptosporangium amethystogenes]|uniref:hypothetical protein n=1 Tax=Streptosporangium amethystogenes TaxID=2002 RepID=UPI00378765C9
MVLRLGRDPRWRRQPSRDTSVRAGLDGRVDRRRQRDRLDDDAGTAGTTGGACPGRRWKGIGGISSAGATGADGSKQGSERSPVRRTRRRMSNRSPEGWAYSWSAGRSGQPCA